MKKILQAGVMLSSERDLNRLLDTVLASVMELANCDAGTLYLADGDVLRFKIMHTNSLGTHSGGDGRDPDLPPVPLRRENVCAYCFLEGRTIRIEDVYSCGEYDFSGPLRYDAMTGYHTQSMLVVPMRNREGEKLGVIQLINALDQEGRIQAFPEDTILALESVTSQAAVAIQNVRYLKEIRELFHSFVRMMSAAIDERSPYNASHSRRMAQFGGRFLDYLNRQAAERGEELPFSEKRREELIMSIWLHDIGKLTTPLEIMNKPERLYEPQKAEIRHRMERIRLLARIDCLEGRISGEERGRLEQDTEEAESELLRISTAGFLPEERLAWLEGLRKRVYRDEEGQERPWLTGEEYEMLSIRKGTLTARERAVMESHVQVTDKLLAQISFSADLSHVREWAGAHHELLNGSGYPEHKSGERIPREVRIITILDIFDALVADDRPYKPGMPVERALRILEEMAEKEGKLDPELTRQFILSRCWEGIPLTGELPEDTEA
ncbi:MAG: GAF domain-containing protein [Roseburia sp.]|nr:GAF domain-containing protein [Roseburia sp.]MCM1096826.1 GAF domain-containing protein [Ruminococcus flavefaciens]